MYLDVDGVNKWKGNVKTRGPFREDPCNENPCSNGILPNSVLTLGMDILIMTMIKHYS